jgi:hypothetical protein
MGVMGGQVDMGSKVVRGGFGYRILAGFYRIIYRLLPDKWRGLPPLAAYYRILPHNDLLGRGVLEYWGKENYGDTVAQSRAELGTKVGKGMVGNGRECWCIGALGSGVERGGLASHDCVRQRERIV